MLAFSATLVVYTLLLRFGAPPGAHATRDARDEESAGIVGLEESESANVVGFNNDGAAAAVSAANGAVTGTMASSSLGEGSDVDVQEGDERRLVHDADSEFWGRWDPDVVLNKPRACHTAALYPGADYFAKLYQLLEMAGSGTEVIFFGWKFDVNTRLLGFPADADTEAAEVEKTHSKLIEVLERAAKRGASVYFQFWKNDVSEVRDSELGMGWNVDKQAELLRSTHPNIYAFIDNGRYRGNYKWDTHIKAVVFDRHVALVGGIDLVDDRWDTKEHLLPDVRRVKCPDRMTGYCEPWQDVGVIVDGMVAWDVAALAYSRQNSYCNQWPRAPSFISDVPSNCGHHLPEDLTLPASYISPYDHTSDALQVLDVEPDTCRAVLSGFQANLGVNQVTTQIHDAYVQAIRESTRYIYMENQYLISRGIGETNPSEWLDLPIIGHFLSDHARNDILNALYERLTRAIDTCDPKFSVVIVAPLAPFESFLLYLNWRFMFHPEHGLVPQLETYLKSKSSSCQLPLTHFFSYNFLSNIRATNSTHAVWYNIFVHSKTMVVDDVFASVGSANINDRSLWGRDGELNINIEGPGAARMRASLLAPHLGSYAASAGDAAAGVSTESLAEAFDRAGTRNVDRARSLGLDFETGIDTHTGEPIMNSEKEDFMTYAIGGAWIGPRAAAVPADDAGHLYKHAAAIWGDGERLQSFMTNASNAFM